MPSSIPIKLVNTKHISLKKLNTPRIGVGAISCKNNTIAQIIIADEKATINRPTINISYDSINMANILIIDATIPTRFPMINATKYDSIVE